MGTPTLKRRLTELRLKPESLDLRDAYARDLAAAGFLREAEFVDIVNYVQLLEESSCQMDLAEAQSHRIRLKSLRSKVANELVKNIGDPGMVGDVLAAYWTGGFSIIVRESIQSVWVRGLACDNNGQPVLLPRERLQKLATDGTARRFKKRSPTGCFGDPRSIFVLEPWDGSPFVPVLHGLVPISESYEGILHAVETY